jgi:hypothetical protein
MRRLMSPPPKFWAMGKIWGATWAQNPPFLCPNKVFEERKANRFNGT